MKRLTFGSSTLALSMTVKPVPIRVGIELPDQVRVGADDAEIADLGRMLRDRDVDQAALQLVDDRGRRVERDHLHLARRARLLDAVRRAEGGEQVGAEHAGEIGVARQHRLQLRGRLVGVVVVELRIQHGDAGMALHLRLKPSSRWSVVETPGLTLET